MAFFVTYWVEHYITIITYFLLTVWSDNPVSSPYRDVLIPPIDDEPIDEQEKNCLLISLDLIVEYEKRKRMVNA